MPDEIILPGTFKIQQPINGQQYVYSVLDQCDRFYEHFHYPASDVFFPRESFDYVMEYLYEHRTMWIRAADFDGMTLHGMKVNRYDGPLKIQVVRDRETLMWTQAGGYQRVIVMDDPTGYGIRHPMYMLTPVPEPMVVNWKPPTENGVRMAKRRIHDASS